MPASDSARSKSVCRTARERPAVNRSARKKALPGLSAAAAWTMSPRRPTAAASTFQCFPRDVQRAEYPSMVCRSRSVGTTAAIAAAALRSRDRLLGATDQGGRPDTGKARGSLRRECPILPFPFGIAGPVYSECCPVFRTETPHGSPSTSHQRRHNDVPQAGEPCLRAQDGMSKLRFREAISADNNLGDGRFCRCRRYCGNVNDCR